MVVFCNSTETNKFVANKKCPKNERAFLRGDCSIYQRQGSSPPGMAVNVRCALRLVQLWSSSKDNLEARAENAWCGCSMSCRPVCSHSYCMPCLWLTKWGCVWETWDENTPQNRRLWSCYFKFLHDLFSDYIQSIFHYHFSSNFEAL